MNVWNIKTMDIRLERTIEGPPAEVFDAWLDPACKGSPWGGVARSILQPHVDGLFYRVHSAANGGYDLAHYGRFLVVDRPGVLKHTWVSQHTRGLESVVTVGFQPQGKDSTRLVLQHENLPDDEMGRMHEGGWSHILGLLADVRSSYTRA